MDIFQANEFFCDMFKNKKVTYDFDEKCICKVEFVCTNGRPHLIQKVECDKAKFMVEGMKPFYVPITIFTLDKTLIEIKELIAGFKDAYIHPLNKQQFNECKEEKDKEMMIGGFMKMTGFTKKQLLKKLSISQ